MVFCQTLTVARLRYKPSSQIFSLSYSEIVELNNVLSASPFVFCVLADFQVRWPFKSSHLSSQSCVGAAADGCAVS